MTEDKRAILNALAKTLKLTRAGRDITKIYLDDIDGWEWAVVSYKDGHTRRVNITADSGVAMIQDVINRIR